MTRRSLAARLWRLLRVILRRILKARGLLAFAGVVLPHLLSDPCAAYHHELSLALDTAVQPGQRLIGALPREHAKTTLGTVALALREVCLGGKRNIMLIAANREEAQAKLRQITQELETNRLIQYFFSRQAAPARDQKGHTVAYADGEIVLAGGARLSTLGFGGKIRGQLEGGRRLDLVILDDPEDDASVQSPDLRRRARYWADHALLNALDVKQGSLVWLGTLLHHDSVLAQWMAHQRETPNWQVIRLAALDDRGEPLWPARWSRERLNQRRREIGERAFAQEYLNQPVSLSLQVFRPEWFRRFDPSRLALSFGEWAYAGEPLKVALGVDPAIGEEARHDYFAACAVGLTQGPDGLPRAYILDMARARLSFSSQLALLKTLARRWLPVRVGIESVAYQAALRQAAWEAGLPAVALGGTQSKAARIETAAVHVEAGRVAVPTDAPWVADFLSEAADYPAGAHDDQLDALARALETGLPLVHGVGEVGAAGHRRELILAHPIPPTTLRGF